MLSAMASVEFVEASCVNLVQVAEFVGELQRENHGLRERVEELDDAMSRARQDLRRRNLQLDEVMDLEMEALAETRSLEAQLLEKERRLVSTEQEVDHDQSSRMALLEERLEAQGEETAELRHMFRRCVQHMPAESQRAHASKQEFRHLASQMQHEMCELLRDERIRRWEAQDLFQDRSEAVANVCHALSQRLERLEVEKAGQTLSVCSESTSPLVQQSRVPCWSDQCKLDRGLGVSPSCERSGPDEEQERLASCCGLAAENQQMLNALHCAKLIRQGGASAARAKVPLLPDFRNIQRCSASSTPSTATPRDHFYSFRTDRSCSPI